MKEVACNFLHTVHIVPRCRSPNPCLPQQQDTTPYAVKISVLRSWKWAKDFPKHVEPILEINKLLLLHLVGFSILLYLHWWCTVKHKSSLHVGTSCQSSIAVQQRTSVIFWLIINHKTINTLRFCGTYMDVIPANHNASVSTEQYKNYCTSLQGQLKTRDSSQ